MQKQWILRSQRVSSQCTNQKLKQDLEEDGDDEREMTGRKLQCELRALRWLPAVERRGRKREVLGAQRVQRVAKSTAQMAQRRRKARRESKNPTTAARLPGLAGLVQQSCSFDRAFGLLGRQQRLSIGNRCRPQHTLLAQSHNRTPASAPVQGRADNSRRTVSRRRRQRAVGRVSSPQWPTISTSERGSRAIGGASTSSSPRVS